MMKETKLFGIDLGNAFNKFIFEGEEMVLPNYYGLANEFKSDDIGQNSYELNSFLLKDDPSHEYVYGMDIHHCEEPIHTYTSENRYSKKNFKNLFQMTLGLMIPSKVEDIIVITGLPSGEMGTDMENQLRESMLGTHIMIVKDRHGREMKKQINVHKVVILAQPIGTYFNLFLTSDAKIKDASLKEQTIAIADLGGGTLDIDTVKFGKTIENDRKTIRIGMNLFYERMAKHLLKKYPSANITSESVERQLRDGCDLYKINARIHEDVSDIKQEIFEGLVQNMISEIDKVWKNKLKFDRIILTGGGASLLYPYLKKEIQGIELASDGQMSNVKGFYKYGKVLLKKLT